MIADSSKGIQKKHLGRSARVEKLGDPAVGVSDDVKGMPVLMRVRADLFRRFEASGVDSDEEDVSLRKFCGHVANKIVVIVRVGAERGEKQDDHSGVGLLCLRQRELAAAKRRHLERRRHGADLQPAESRGNRDQKRSNESGRCAP